MLWIAPFKSMIINMECARPKLNIIIQNTTALDNKQNLFDSPWCVARISDKYAIQLNDSNSWWWPWIMTDLWYISELKFGFQTLYYIGAATLFSGDKSLHEITWFYKIKISTWNLPIKMTSNCISLTSGTFPHSQERLFLYKKAFLEVGSSITHLPFTKSWLAGQKLIINYRCYF